MAIGCMHWDLSSSLSTNCLHCSKKYRLKLNVKCSGGARKPAERMVSALRKARGDHIALKSIARKASASSKAVQLTCLQQLLRHHDWDLALPIYKTITQAHWYEWNAKLHANLIVLLEKYEQWDEAQSSLELTKNLSPAGKVRFYCALIEFYSKFGLKDQVLSAYDILKELPHKSVHVIGYKSLINALAVMNFPHEAEEILKQMKGSGCKPSADEFKCILYSYGRCGHFQEMERTLELLEGCGYLVDTATMNMVLKSYGSSQDYGSIMTWLKRMQAERINLSTRTYNAVANSCPTLVSFALLHKAIPLSTRSLLNVMANRENISEELLLVEELLSLGLLPEITDWSSKQWALDFHGLVPSAAYVIILVWLDELKSKIEHETKLPSEIFLVCGLGNHSPTRGHSSVKTMISEMMFKMKSPFKLDRLNKGRFIARGNTVKAWLSQVSEH